VKRWEVRQASCFTCSRWWPSWPAWTSCSSGIAIALSVSADTLVFDAERNPDEELRLQLEATQHLTDQDKELVKRFINGLLLSHEAKRLAA
jgi:hypothetical protein